MAYNIGLNVVEVDGSGAPAIVGAAVSVAAFNITTRRGVANRPVRVTSFRQFVEQFGSFTSSSYGAYMVRGFFDNGGQTAYINRIVSTDPDPNTGSQRASRTLNDLAAAATLDVRAGQRGRPDPGAWGNDLYVRAEPTAGAVQRLRESAAAAITGEPLAAQVNMAALPVVSLRVDGETTPTEVRFTAADFANPAQATPAEIRNVINRQSKVQAEITPDSRLVIRSTGAVAQQNRRFTRVELTAAVAALGFAAPAAADAQLAELTTTGTRLGKSEDFAAGDALEITDGTRTARVKVLRVTPQTGAIEWVPTVANAGEFNRLQTRVSRLDVRLTLALGGTDEANIVETWNDLSMESDSPRYALRVLNDELSGSRYVTLTNRGSASGPGQNRPNQTTFARLENGSDGVPTVNDFIGDQAQATGFNAFDPADVQLLTCERTDPMIVNAALGYCANRGDCMYIGVVPFGYVGARQAVSYGQAFQGRKVYGALYGPWIKVADPAGSGAAPAKFVPPAGHVMGIYARIETNRGIWKAPAGDEAIIAGAIDIEYQLSDADHTDLVKNGSVNGIRAVPGAGIVVDASRTLSTDTRWLYVNVRLLFNYVKSSLKRGLRWVRQEPNRDTLWTGVKFGSVRPFLLDLWRQGAFGTGKPDEVFTIVCDASNNPPDQVDQGIFKVEVYFYPSRPAETIVIVVGQQPSGASASEA
jgi:phage tail sheath protein FI